MSNSEITRAVLKLKDGKLFDYNIGAGLFDPDIRFHKVSAMPIYEYTCHACKRRVSLLWQSFADAESREPICPRCGGKHLTRLISRVSVVRSEGSRLDDVADPGSMDGVDENDPKSLAHFMRKMASETGEDLGPEFEEVVGRLEAGEDPESIEETMPGLAGEGSTTSMGGDDFGVM